MWKSSGMFKLYFFKKKEESIYDNLMFDLFPEDDNSTRQTGRATFVFLSPGRFDTRIDNTYWKNSCRWLV